MKAQGRTFWATVAAVLVIASVGTTLSRQGRAAVLPLGSFGSPASGTSIVTGPSDRDAGRTVVGPAWGLTTTAVYPLGRAKISEFREVPWQEPLHATASPDLWARKLIAIGAMPAAEPKPEGLERILQDYGGGEGKLSALLTSVGSFDQVSNTRYLVPRCDTWVCGELERAIPGVAIPLAFAVIAFVAVGRIRRRRSKGAGTSARIAS